MQLIRTFKQISKQDVALAGGKGASLGEMTQAGVPVPPGFVILSNAFEHFLKLTNLDTNIQQILSHVNKEKLHTVEQASKKIKTMIIATHFPNNLAQIIKQSFTELNTTFVAVRSSATAEDSAKAAWAGQLETFLNTTEKTLLKNVKECWASLFTPQAIFYRFEKNLQRKKISVAVVIQKMVNSEMAGVAFSVHPVTQNRNQILIEASFGLGEAVVSGQVTPDNYVVDKMKMKLIHIDIAKKDKALYRKPTGGIEWKNINNTLKLKRVLSAGETTKLSKIIIAVEDHYGFPVDIEWAKGKNQFFIVQSRPITTISSTNINKIQKTNIKSNTQKYEFQWGERCSLLMVDCWARNHGPYLLGSPKSIDYIITSEDKFAEAYASANMIKEWDAFSKALLQKNKRDSILKSSALARAANFKFFEQFQKLNLADVSSPELYNLLTTYVRHFGFFAKHFGMSHAASLDTLTHHLEELLNKEGYGQFLHLLVTPIIPDLIADEQAQLSRIGLNKKVNDDILYQHALNNSFLFYNSYNLQKNLDFLRDRLNNKSHYSQKLMELKKIKKEQEQIFKKVKNNKIKDLCIFFQKMANDRLELKNAWAGAEFRFLKLFKTIANRIGINLDDMMAAYTFKDYENSLLKNKTLTGEQVTDRIRRVIIWKKYNVTRVVEDKPTIARLFKLTKNADHSDDPKEIRGMVANKGTATGKVRIVQSIDIDQVMKDLKTFNKGDILVTWMTQPNMMPIAQKAGAIIADQGGITSHAAVIAREFGVPCIVGTKNATKLLKEGDIVEVDANLGFVKILKN